MKIIYILWFRQIKRYIRSRSRLVGSLGQPILFLVALGYGFGPIYAKATGGGNFIQFLAPGVICMGILFTAIFAGIEVIWDKQFGFLKETLVAPVSRFQIMLGRTLGGATVATIQGLLVLVITFFVGFHPNPVMIIPGIIAMFVIALLFTAMGTAIASRLEDMQGFQVIMNFLVMPIFFLSGALFPLSGLPPVIEFLTRIDPLSYGVDAIRGLLGSGAALGLGVDTIVLLGVTIVMIWLGAFFFSRIEA